MGHAYEDWYGLFELLFEIEGSPPELTLVEDRRATLTAALAKLLKARLIELGVRPSPAADAVTVDTADEMSLLADDSSWRYPYEDSTVVVFTATPLGVE